MQISLFVRDPFKGRDKQDRPRWAFNPYFYTERFEVCLDRDGWLVRWGDNYRRGDWRVGAA